MVYIDVAELAATTNFAHQKLLDGNAALAGGDYPEARARVLEAAKAVCRTMQDVFKPQLDGLSEEMPRDKLESALRDIVGNRVEIRQFLSAEEKTLIDAGLEPGLVKSVMDRCVEFLDQEPDQIRVKDLKHAFAAAEYRVCGDAIEQLASEDGNIGPSRLRMYGVPILNSAIGATIIGANYKFLGPAEWFFSISSGYGASWFPSGFSKHT